MRFKIMGNVGNPVIIMLTGSFCASESMAHIYDKMKDDYFIMAPTYTGHYEGSGNFTTRQGEAACIIKYLIENNIENVHMVYGQSMGGEVAIELMKQMQENNIAIGYGVFDGAPCIKLSKAYKKFMYYKFKTMINIARKRGVEGIANLKFLHQFTNGDNEALRTMIENLVEVSDYLSDETIKNENECCYTFDYPKFNEEIQKRMYFLYDINEKAFKTCYKLVKKAYPSANYKVFRGYGHLTYSVKHTDRYVKWLKKFI